MAFLGRVAKRIADAGGLGSSLRWLIREGKIPAGKFVGEDSLGNKYYENTEVNIFGGHRYVDYAKKEFDASQVTAEWHAWFHKMTDDIPTPPEHGWQTKYVENVTGTKEQYVPYTTVKPKVESWKPQ